MSIFNPQFQVISDLHLETPIFKPSYQTFNLDSRASNLFLLGDIGLVKQEGLFTFLERLLASTPNLQIFYVLGNHEPYGISLAYACLRMKNFEAQMTPRYGHRFIFLHRTQYNISPTITILGCTLWTNIQPEQATNVFNRLTDFVEDRGIRDWGLEEHNLEHRTDLQWLNAEVQRIEEEEPHRHVIILTHHSPTTDPRANDPIHASSPISSGFVTDLSSELCWTSAVVKVWAFGHTHYSFSYRDEGTGKVVLANQKGYSGLAATSRRVRTKVLELSGEKWDVLTFAPESVERAKGGETHKKPLPIPAKPPGNRMRQWWKRLKE